MVDPVMIIQREASLATHFKEVAGCRQIPSNSPLMNAAPFIGVAWALRRQNARSITGSAVPLLLQSRKVTIR